MAIHGVEGELLNANDFTQQRQTLGFGFVSPTIDGQKQGKIVTKNSQLIVNDGNYNRIVIGQRNDGTYGIKVSKNNTDALTTDNSNLVMNSDYNMFKIIATGTGTVYVTGAGQFTTTVSHNLGYTPAFKAFGNYPTAPAGAFYALELSIPIDSTPTVNGYSTYAIMRAYADSTNIYFSVWAIGGITNGNWPFRYYLFQETSN